MNKFTLGYTRKIDASFSVEILDKEIDSDNILGGLIYGEYEIMLDSGVIVDTSGNTIAKISDYQEHGEMTSEYEDLE